MTKPCSRCKQPFEPESNTSQSDLCQSCCEVTMGPEDFGGATLAVGGKAYDETMVLDGSPETSASPTGKDAAKDAAKEAGKAEGKEEDKKTIGKYPIVGRLGVGGMGEVYKATHPELGHFVAVKIIRTTDAQMARELELRLRIGKSRGAGQVQNAEDLARSGGTSVNHEPPAPSRSQPNKAFASYALAMGVASPWGALRIRGRSALVRA